MYSSKNISHFAKMYGFLFIQVLQIQAYLFDELIITLDTSSI